jgi:adenylylsulfate kinase
MNGAILWFTGMSGGGKSTLAHAVGARVQMMRAVEILDGDDVRTHLSKGLGFSREDRDINVRRIGFVARLLARHGVFVITAAISPYADVRDEMRQLASRDGIPFIDVFVNAQLESLVKRDVKGLYKRALAGEIPHFTGVSDPYEPPRHPDIVVRTDAESVETSVETILDALVARGLVSPPAVTG